MIKHLQHAEQKRNNCIFTNATWIGIMVVIETIFFK